MLSTQLPRTLLFATAWILIGISNPLTGPGAILATDEKDDPTKSEKGVNYTTPKGWRAVEGSAFLIAKFQVGPADQGGTFTISALTAPAGGLAANINRWRTQVGLEALEDADVLKTAREMKADSQPGHAIDITGPRKDGKPAQRIMAAIVTKGDQVWFFKLTGPAELVGNQKAAYDEFLKSVRFRKS